MAERYEKRRLLGRGGMGEVWLAFDHTLGRDVALKYITGQESDDLARFKREARLAAKLSHPGIVAVHDVGDAFIVMDFIDGRSADAAELPPRAAADVVRQAAAAVHAAHEQGVVHRDLKPANILVAGDRAFVTDFGLAKALGSESSISLSGDIFGTPAYMPPEQAQGRLRDVGPRSDVYGLGATLYALLARKAPFAGANAYDVILKVIDADPSPLAGVDPDLAVIVGKAMDKDPARRYASARAMADDLARYLAGEAIEAHAPSTFYRIRKRLAKRKALVAAVAALVLLGAAFGTYAVVQSFRAARREQSLKELGALMNEVTLAREGMYQPRKSPARFRADLEAAVARVDRFVAAHPDLPQGLYARAIGRFHLDDPSGAESDLRASVALAPDFGPGWWLLSRVLLERYAELWFGTDSDAEREALGVRLQAILKDARTSVREASLHLDDPAARWGMPPNPEDAVTRVLTKALTEYVLDKDPAASDATLADALRANPSEAVMAWMSLFKKNDERESLLRRAIETAPHYAFAYARLAYDLCRQGRIGEALAPVERALEISPSNGTAVWIRGSVRVLLGDMKAGLADFDRAIRLLPFAPGPLIQRAALYCDLRRWDDAVTDATEALRRFPGLSSALAVRSRARAGTGDLDGALEDARTGRRADPSNGDLYLAEANVYEVQALPAKAEAVLADGIRVARHPSLLHIGRGLFRMRRADPAGAREDFDRAVALDPTDAKAFAFRGLIHMNDGHHDDAAEDFERALRSDPRCVQALVHRSMLKRRLKDLAGARADLDRALEIDDLCTAALNERAFLRFQQDDLPGALEDLDRWARTEPQNALPVTYRGFVKVALDDLDGGLADHDRALMIDPNCVQALVNRARARALGGNWTGVRADADEFLKRAPNHQDAPEARRLLEQASQRLDDF